MKEGIKFRHVYFVFGVILAILLTLVADPDSGVGLKLPFGASTVSFLIYLFSTVLYVGIHHISLKACFDYFNMFETIQTAVSTPVGAGLVVIGVGLHAIAIALVLIAAVG